MEYGVHLPLIDFSGKGFSLAELRPMPNEPLIWANTFG